MKKILTMALAFALVLSLAVSAYAYDGTTANTTASWTSWWDWWSGFTPNDPTEPSDPTVPEVEIGISTITESRFYHSASVASLRNRLQISWNAVDGAESYEIEVTKADGTVLTYTASSNSLMVKNMACPKVYVEATSTWTAATVRVRAMAGDVLGGWSAAAKIGCDAIH